MKKSIFENKQQYLNFRKAFASAVNDPRAKSTVVTEPRWPYSLSERGRQLVTRRFKGWIKPEHFILLNAIRGKKLDNGFTNITNRKKLDNGMKSDYSFYEAHHRLDAAIRAAKTYLENINKPLTDFIPKFGFEIERVNKMTEDERQMYLEKRKQVDLNYLLSIINLILQPFNQTLTIEQLSKLDITKEHYNE